MASPASKLASGALYSAGHLPFSLLSHMAHGLLSAMTTPFVTGVAQDQWSGKPILLPDPGAIYNAYLRGFLPEGVARTACALSGVALDPGISLFRKGGVWPQAWRGVMNAALHVPSPDAAMIAFAHGLADAGERDAMLRRSGANRRRYIDHPQLWYEPLSIASAMEAVNREIITPQRFAYWLNRNGVNEDEVSGVLTQLRALLPGAEQLTVMHRMGAFSNELASAMGLYDEQSVAYRRWMSRIGFFGTTGVIINRDGVKAEADWADMFWASHRPKLSLLQAAHAIRRLRPESIHEVQRFVPTAKVFDREQLYQIFRIHGYPAPWHPLLEELSYVPLSLREIRTSVKLGIRDRDWLVSRLQDQGHRQDRANDLADILYAQAEWQKNAPLRGLEASLLRTVNTEVLHQYELGTVSREQADFYLRTLGINKDVVEQYLNVIDARVHNKIAREGLNATKKDYIAGILNAEEAMSQLLQMGIVQQRATQYLSLWTIRRGRVRRTATSAQILRYVSEGLEDPQTAETRLRNLGWDNPDIAIMLAEARGKLTKMAATRRAAEQRSRAQAASELEKVQRQQQALAKQLIRDQRALTPRATLDKWLCDGLISGTYYLRRMAAMGYTAQTAFLYMQDAKKKKACAPASSEPTNGEEKGNGAGGESPA